ncbi:hypothetical protein Xmau_01712 [Xenorhabdus mauleonii]|uniref:Uncharacterized protein n=1 Tax=Xenorhabdus mauleonii TaxID=351675 RepID=A0A1I3L585_9GAMM|nr:hypothetical protein [Xenorhabdus mauleonii]PHM44552.1 hypothetical protein Xmau_01712 [Xenorhabdus mauleonii]SFI79851.1 hypothetical protein SAMN05421680_103298 [Xenorhabdus mauleonii]
MAFLKEKRSRKPYISEPIHYKLNEKHLTIAFRWDSRPPEIINTVGFQGSNQVYFNKIFGKRTVFCAADEQGADYYFQELENGMWRYGSSITYYLYKIDLSGIPTVPIYENRNLGFAKQLATRDPKIESFIEPANKDYALPAGYILTRVSNYLEQVAANSHEIQILGPIKPEKIRFCESRTLRSIRAREHYLGQ